MAWSLAM